MNALTRREFLRVASLTGAATLAGACVPVPAEAPGGAPTLAPTALVAPEAQTTAVPTTESAPAPRYSEAPQLAELVAQGALPPVDERLPMNPDICPVTEMTGRYGGMLRRAYNGVSDANGPNTVAAMSLIWFNLDLSLRPCVAESWEVNDDATEWTFRLREGMHWSDGEPFTSEAFRWYWDHVLADTRLTPVPLVELVVGRRFLAELDTPDDVTVTFAFGQPNPLFGYRPTMNQPFVPGHYLQQYHPDFADQEEIDRLVQASGLSTWENLFANREQWVFNPDRPSVNPWFAANPLGEELFTMQRNPYFWQVDPDGQQLPYIDTIQHRLFESPDVYLLWILNGEIDLQSRLLSIGNYTLLKEGEQAGDYRVELQVGGSHIGMQVNLTTKEPRLREFFNDRRVRQALSYAVDRYAINDLVYNGLGVPRQYSPAEHSPQYHAELSNAYIEYDPEQANTLLDEAGYSERDAEGFRTFADGSGEPISFIIEGMVASGTPDEDAAQMATQYLAEVGIKATYRYFERSLHSEHIASNAIEGAWRGGDRAMLPIVTPSIFVGVQADRPWALAWSLWKNSGGSDPNGEEPPEGHWIWDIWSIWEQLSVEADDEQRDAMFRQILDIWVEELPMLCYVGQFPSPVIVRTA